MLRPMPVRITAQLWSHRYSISLAIIFAVLVKIVLTVDPQLSGLLPFAKP